MKLLKRKIDKYLLDWKNNPKRKPLIVKGARFPYFLTFLLKRFLKEEKSEIE